MILLRFNTSDHTLQFNYEGEEINYENVVTIKTHDEYYEVLQRQIRTEKNAPLLRVPITKTIIEFTHE
jgi:hypothetical protein